MSKLHPPSAGTPPDGRAPQIDIWLYDRPHYQIASGRKNDLNAAEWARLLTIIHQQFPYT